MTRQALRGIVLDELCRLAPELDREAVADGLHIRDEIDLDSFDFVRLLARLDERLGVAIPEADYGKLDTLGACLDYLAEKLAARASAQPQKSRLE